VLKDEQFQAVKVFVYRYLQESFSNCDQQWKQLFPRSAEYRWQHTLNVLRNSEKIIAGESVSEAQADILRWAAILHDVTTFEGDHEVHAQVGAETAKKYLLEQGYGTDFVNHVCQAVAEHGIDLGPLSPAEQGKLLSWAGKALIEADILDKLGASAVTSALLMLGQDGKLNHECHAKLLEGVALQRANFFNDYIWTDTGKKLAEKRLGFFQNYLEQLAEEVVETEMPE
jgi:putative nucleotidyltransferase with HDIG domain